MTTKIRANEVTCVPGWTLPLLWKPPAVRRRKKKGTHVLDVFTEVRTETERDTDRPTDLPPPPCPPLPAPSRERTRCMQSHSTEAKAILGGLWTRVQSVLTMTAGLK